MADDLAPIRNALTERAGDLARDLIGEPTAASKRELRRGRHGALSALVVEHARPQSRAKRPRNGKSSPSSEGAS